MVPGTDWGVYLLINSGRDAQLSGPACTVDEFTPPSVSHDYALKAGGKEDHHRYRAVHDETSG
ncbi:CIC11C00000002281 [Sungouiella intermedia]|uniref:CIC11C00000002281 n=1 Tax=Sungouiella intermedia TaxID=45354 RepID=A0A1L0C0W6_9ASCO|nr:CIC11C00000002281 [[Candida] intermedia]